ncbi:MAG: DinB family protein [Chlorobi bacterium]|nr:DinB family protein [Chlorobiota bacterium]MCI0714830.1 DinB family protein [Chlorobiota bacterium]
MTVLPKELEQLASEFRSMKKIAGDFLTKVRENEFNKRPPDNGWSIAECIDHLIVTGDDYCNKFEEALAILEQKNRRYTKEMKYNWFVRKFITNVEPPVKRKLKAPAKWRPATNIDKAKATAAYLQLQDRWVDLINQSAEWDTTKTRLLSPAVDWIKFTAFEILGVNSAHQRRHFDQAKRVKNSI